MISVYIVRETVIDALNTDAYLTIWKIIIGIIISNSLITQIYT